MAIGQLPTYTGARQPGHLPSLRKSPPPQTTAPLAKRPASAQEVSRNFGWFPNVSER